MTAKHLFDRAYALVFPDDGDTVLLGHENRYALALVLVQRALNDCRLPAVEGLNEELPCTGRVPDALEDALCVQVARYYADETRAQGFAERFRANRPGLLASAGRRADVLPGREVRG